LCAYRHTIATNAREAPLCAYRHTIATNAREAAASYALASAAAASLR